MQIKPTHIVHSLLHAFLIYISIFIIDVDPTQQSPPEKKKTYTFILNNGIFNNNYSLSSIECTSPGVLVRHI